MQGAASKMAMPRRASGDLAGRGCARKPWRGWGLASEARAARDMQFDGCSRTLARPSCDKHRGLGDVHVLAKSILLYVTDPRHTLDFFNRLLFTRFTCVHTLHKTDKNTGSRPEGLPTPGPGRRWQFAVVWQEGRSLAVSCWAQCQSSQHAA